MKIKRIITAFLMSAIAMTTASVLSVDAAADTETKGTAYLAFTNGNGVENLSAGDVEGSVNADITGTGKYSVSVPVSSSPGELKDGGWFMAVQTDININDYDFEITIDSIKFDDKDITYKGASDGSVTTAQDGTSFRYSIYDQWTSENKTNDVEFDIADSPSESVTVNFTVTKFEAKEKDETTASETSGTEETSASDTSSTESTSEETSETDASSSNSESATKTTSTTTAKTTSSSSKATTAVSTTQATVNTTASAETTPSTGVTGVAGLVALAGLATGIAGFSRKK